MEVINHTHTPSTQVISIQNFIQTPLHIGKDNLFGQAKVTGNMLANYLANMAFDTSGRFEIRAFQICQVKRG